MFNKLADWLNDRTGYRALVHEALEEPIPGGARWRYVFGSALSTTFAIQLVTGVLLMCSYSPSSSTAWGSVFYISQSQWMGWFIRGIHHFGSQAMVVLLPLHLLQVLTARAYRAPREVNWWFGMALLFLTLGFSLTGYLLPWDQKGYWATKVATNIMGGAPGLGPYVQKILVGGSDYGNQTVTRFYGLHVGILPLLFIMCLVAHVALFRRHGPTPPRDAHQRVTGTFWPEQLFRDAVASVVVVGIMLSLVLSEHGANLDAPADPSSPDYPARPEWYFLSLFQLLKLFPGDREVIGTIIIPSAILVVMLLIPLFDRIMPSKLAHVLACCFVFALVGGAGYLTYAAWKSDAHDIVFQEQRKRADQARQRALEVAAQGIPPEGSAYVLLHDPLYHGRGMLEKKCLICHYYDGQGQVMVDASGKATSSPQRASDLKDFGARAWLRGLLENPKSDHYFGKVPQCRGMSRWRKKTKLTPKELDDIADFFAQYVITTPPDITPAEWEHQEGLQNHPGYVAFHKEGECVMCHAEWGAPNDEAPNLFGWGSPRWIAKMIHRPGASVLYGFLKPKDQMPAFTSDQLTENDVTMIIRFLKNDIGPRPAPAEAPRAEVAEAARRERP